MKHITALLLTKNNESVIRDCLRSLNFVDEIVVIDDQSTDATCEIVRSFGAKLYKHTLIDFADQRNFALSKADSDWYFFIDADERVSLELQKEICSIVQSS